jgi:uncharacterized repeat protein (TIGR02543 family)
VEVKGFQFENFKKGGEKVKNKVLLISLAVVLALSISLIGCGGGAGQQEEEEEPEIPKYNLTVSSTQGGSIINPGAGISTYDEGTNVDLVAVANEGYVFNGWTGDVGNIADDKNPITTITMNADYIITASFKELPEQPTKLVIGMARDMDEGLAVFEMLYAGPVVREFVEQVNLAGGVHLSAYDTATKTCYVPLEIDRRDINVAAWDIADVTAKICADIANGDTHFLWGGPTIDTIIAQAPVASETKTVLLTLEGGSAGIRNDPDKLASWPYVFNTLSFSDWYQLPVLSDMLEAELGRTPKAYVAYMCCNEHGEGYLAVAEDNFDVVGSVETLRMITQSEANTVIQNAITVLGNPASPNYDIFCGFGNPLIVQALTQASIDNNFNPPAIVFGPDAEMGYYPYSYGIPSEPFLDPSRDPSLVDGILAFTVAAYDTNAEIQVVYDLIAEREDDDEGDPISGVPDWPGILSRNYWGTSVFWAGLEMWLEAVERVGYVDQELLRDALAGLEDDPADTILGDCWFRMLGADGEGGGHLDYLCHTGEIGQWQSGEFETVGYDGITADLPNYVVTADFMFPMTDQWNWLP